MPKCIKHTCKDCIHFKICNDYEYLIGRENKVACPDFKSTEDVVPRSEVEQLQKQLNDYKRVCGELYFTESGNAVFKVKETEIKVEYVPAKINDIRVREAKQEVAEWVVAELKKCLEIRIYNVRKLINKIEKKYIGEKR